METEGQPEFAMGHKCLMGSVGVICHIWATVFSRALCLAEENCLDCYQN